jgi:hypothetical protein
MSDIHVLKGSVRGETISKQYAFHYVIPTGDRVANAGADPALIDFVSAAPDIDTGELSDIQLGIVVEVVQDLDYHESESNASIQARVIARYNAIEQAVIDRYKEVYRQYLTTFDAS